MRVVIFCRVRLFGEALAACLNDHDGMDEVVSCYVSEQLVELAIGFVPDLILFHVTGEHSLQEAGALSDSCPDTPIVALAVPDLPQEVIACADAGFVGYAPLGASVSELSQVMRMALKGECACQPKIAGNLLRELRRRRKDAQEPLMEEPLTLRECEVLRLAGQGLSNKELSNKEIARELVIGVATVKNHLHNAFVKLGIKSRREVLLRWRNELSFARLAPERLRTS